MFKKLRNKFLILNMSITSLVMIAAFVTIYFITYSSTYAKIKSRLDSKPEVHVAMGEGDQPDDGKEESRSTVQNFSPEDPPSFDIEVDADGKVLNINSFLDMPEEVYYKAAGIAWKDEKAWDGTDHRSTITLEGKQWQYAILPLSSLVIQKNGQQYTVQENKYHIVFLDVTEFNKTLFELLTTLLFVGVIMLFVIFVLSLYFANRAIKPIAEAWEKQKRFVADASHELKTPLSIINANYDALLANREETVQSQMKWLDYIKIGTDRMTSLINDLLSLARIENANTEIERVPFNMSDAVRETVTPMEPVAMEKGIRVSHSIEPDIIIRSDPERVKQVVAILFDNAIKYANENGEIDISLIKSRHQVTCSVKNSGKGIAVQDLQKVFDRFYRADPARTHENGGYGLGLSIAKTIIERLGGNMHVASAENQYTTFTFTFASDTSCFYPASPVK